jgi:hypothetical protein
VWSIRLSKFIEREPFPVRSLGVMGVPSGAYPSAPFAAVRELEINNGPLLNPSWAEGLVAAVADRLEVVTLCDGNLETLVADFAWWLRWARKQPAMRALRVRFKGRWGGWFEVATSSSSTRTARAELGGVPAGSVKRDQLRCALVVELLAKCGKRCGARAGRALSDCGGAQAARGYFVAARVGR